MQRLFKFSIVICFTFFYLNARALELFRTDITKEDLFGWWIMPRYNYRVQIEHQQDQEKDYFILYRNYEHRMFSKFQLFDNMTYFYTSIRPSCTPTNEHETIEGQWSFDASTKEVHFDQMHLSFRVIMIIGNVMIIEDLK